MEGFKLVFFGASVLLLATRVLAREFLLDVPNGSIQWKPPRSQNGSGIIKFRVQMELEAKKWVAVGFSPRGDMFDGGDFCVLWTDPNGLFELNDAYVEDGSLLTDEPQDCFLKNVNAPRNRIEFEFWRKPVTCDDEHDYRIDAGTTHFHVVWGPGPLIDIAGVSLNQSEGNSLSRVQLLKPEAMLSTLPRSPDVHHFDVLVDGVHIPAQETTYWCTVVRLPEVFLKKHHILEFEPIIDKANKDIVHHMEVFHCESDSDIPMYNGPCTDPKKPLLVETCKRVMAAWAMSALPFIYPLEAGFPIGGKGFNPYVRLEVHYNNPQLEDGHVDNSGMRLWVTQKLRPHDAGIMELGLEYTPKMAIPPSMDMFSLSGDCISECTTLGLPGRGIHVFGSQLHTHLTGIRVVTRHIRDGTELPPMNYDDHYSTHFQEIRILEPPVHVLPGDALITTCTYRTIDRTNVTLGGFSISDEMCVNYIHYYPKTNLEVCKSSIDSASLGAYFQFEHEWEDQATSPDLGVIENYHSIEWDPLRSKGLFDYYLQSPLSMQCNQSNGDRFPGNWEGMPQTDVRFPLPQPEYQCKENGVKGMKM